MSETERRLTRAWLDIFTHRQIDNYLGQIELGEYFEAIITLQRLQEWMKHYDKVVE